MADKPKIVQVTIEAHEGNGGVYTAVQHFARALASWSRPLTVDFTAGASGHQNASTVNISKNWLGRKFGWINRQERLRFENRLRDADFVIIHVPYRCHAGLAADWCRRKQVPYAFVPHGAFDPYVFTYRAWQKKAWMAAVGEKLLAQAACIIFASQGEAKKAWVHGPLKNNLVLSWPTATPTPRDREAARARVRARFKLKPENRLLLYLGRLHSMKRPLETAAAFRAAAPSDWTLIMAGPEDGVFKKELQVDQRVEAVGAIFGEEKEDLLWAADGLVLFSHRENFGFAVAEALARGTPVVISNELDLAPEIISTESGWVTDARTAAGREQGIAAITGTSRAEALRRGERGRVWVSEELSEEKFTRKLRESIEKAMGARAKEFAC